MTDQPLTEASGGVAQPLAGRNALAHAGEGIPRGALRS
jgi:hypothetical protein